MDSWILIHNERVKWWSSLLTNLGAALLGAVVVAWWLDKEEPWIGIWVLGSAMLLISGNRVLTSLEAEVR